MQGGVLVKYVAEDFTKCKDQAWIFIPRRYHEKKPCKAFWKIECPHLQKFHFLECTPQVFTLYKACSKIH
jgi:hypothetical protein